MCQSTGQRRLALWNYNDVRSISQERFKQDLI